MRGHLVSLLILTGGVMAQQELLLQDEVQAELGRRRLLELPLDRVPRGELVDLLRRGDADPVWRAASVLVYHGLGTTAVAGLLDHEDRRLRSLALRCADATQLVGFLARADEEPGLRRQALLALEDLRGLEDEELVTALADPEKSLRDAALVVVLYERVPLSGELLDRVLQRPDARRALLAGLARKRRRDADPWLRQLWSLGSLDPVERLHVIAALPPEGLSLAMAREVLDAGGNPSPDVIDAAHRAAANLPANLADGLIAELRWRTERGENVENFLPYLVKTSPAGDEHLLAVASGLEPDACESICAWLVRRGSAGLQERVRAALDGEIPLELHLLSRAGGLLDRPERVRRVMARLVHGSEAEQLKAFDVLVRAGVYDPAMLDYATRADAGTSIGVRQLAGLPPGRLPDAALLALLASNLTGDVVHACQAAAAGRVLGPEVERVVLELAQGPHSPEIRVNGTRAMMYAGSAAGVRGLWGQLVRTPDLQIDAVRWLAGRRDPWVRELLLEALAEARPRVAEEDLPPSPGTRRGEALVDFLCLALARLGDRGAMDELIASAGERSARFLRQCRRVCVEAMGMEHAERIAEQLRGPGVPESVRIELVSWLGMRPDLEVQEALERLAESDPSEWVRMEARRGLLAGPRRVALAAELFQAMVHALDDRLGELAYEMVATARPPLTEGDMELMARLALQAPLMRPEEEVRRDLTIHSPRAGYPMLGLVIQQLRRDPRGRPGAAFATVVDEVLARGDFGLLSRRRCLSFLLQSCLDPRVRGEVGPPVARLLLAIPEGQGQGPAHLLLGEQAEAEAHYQRASEHFVQAARAMLRDPDPRSALRAFLGDRDAVRGIDPLAALAARGPLLAARAALERGDRPRAARQLTVAAEMAVGDHDTAREVLRLQTELNR